MTGIADTVLSPAFLIYLPLSFLIGNALVFIIQTLRPKAFPPGPRGLPGLGNLLQVDRYFPFLTYSKWAKDYGNDTPLGIKKGATNVVILNSGRLVRELFERRGAVYSDRPWQFMNNTWVFKDDLRAAIFQNSSPWLSRWRRDFNNNFGTAAITRHRPVYEAETARLLVKLLESPTASGVNLEAILVCWMMSVPCLAVCGRRPDGMRDHGFEIKQFRHCSDEYAALVAPNAGDLFPVLRYLPEFFGVAEWKERARAVREGVINTGTQFLSAAKEQRVSLDEGKAIAWESVLAKMLREQHEKNDEMFTATDMGNTAFHIVSAATNTSLAVFSIMLLILAKYPELQQRVRDEVLEVSGGANPKASDLPNLKYTDAFWNETHRWRPVAPQGVAHAPSQDDIYNGHRIPKGTAILMNVWHIHHSEEDYEEPDKFIPERFLHHPFGMRLDEAHDPAQMEASSSRVTYDFGAGRRICPGMHSAKQSLLLGLAKVLWAFDVLPSEGKKIDLDLETGFVQEIALHPKDLDVVFKLRSERTDKDILEHYSQTYEVEAEMMGWEDGRFK
ncbi:cytochrome P450 3 monooxygenase [Penicillium verhagenii]|nr:cytochrome P450 3 monooxygenase [Penicillium verhagenii]